LFAGLTPSERNHLAEQTRVERFPAGALVFGQGDAGEKLYIVAEGRVEVLVRGDRDPADELGRVVAHLGIGDYFGEIALLNDEPRTASVRAIEPAVCYTLSRAGFARLLEATPSNRASLDRLAMERVRETRAGLGAVLSGGSR